MMPKKVSPFTFIMHQWFDTLILAHMLDSLVRVSRRAGAKHFANIADGQKTAARAPRQNRHYM